MMASTPNDRDGGFSLLEMLIVLAIVGLVSALAWTRLSAAPDRLNIAAATSEIAAHLRKARADAMRLNIDQLVTFDLRQRTIEAASSVRPARIATTLQLALSGAGLEAPSNDVRLIRFRPDGSACDAVIHLKQGAAVASLVVDWITGTTRVEWGGHAPGN